MVLRDAALGSPGGDGPGMVAMSSKSVLEGLKAFKAREMKVSMGVASNGWFIVENPMKMDDKKG